ncbi:CatB-related O-acetyltransferase [Prevotella sp. 10(H)]|uniref:CatB-related O-acetyltransferase n=1 Tax=Prevotella sp. 10(H) TaxID=1158294 RepID=UPI0009DCE220|nr:CatB-related O-acetyltransferase [Prevotella sp. 10(H)]
MGIRSFTFKILRKIIKPVIEGIYSNNPRVTDLLNSTDDDNLFFNRNNLSESVLSRNVKLTPPYKIQASTIGEYTYISQNSLIINTTIGKFCSIGPNLVCGWGIHPTNGISTAPMFYSTLKQNGITLSDQDKIEELKSIIIGNDVFIGMNVSILDGVNIGDGAIVGAGCVVSKNIPPYAIAVGNPMKILHYRFGEETIRKMLHIKWWDWNFEELKNVEELFFDIEDFVGKYYKTQSEE